MKRAKAQPQTAQVSELVPRRRPGTQGRRAPNYPDLNFRRIAEAIGISSTFLGRIMNGRVRASIGTAQKLAAYLGWRLDQVAALYEDKALAEKFPYRKKEKAADGKSLKRAAGRGERSGDRKGPGNRSTSRSIAPSGTDRTHGGKQSRKTGAAATRRKKVD